MASIHFRLLTLAYWRMFVSEELALQTGNHMNDLFLGKLFHTYTITVSNHTDTSCSLFLYFCIPSSSLPPSSHSFPVNSNRISYKLICPVTWPSFNGSPREATGVIFDHCKLSYDMEFGHTKVFIRSPQTLTYLERRRADTIPYIVLILQKVRHLKIDVGVCVPTNCQTKRMK